MAKTEEKSQLVEQVEEVQEKEEVKSFDANAFTEEVIETKSESKKEEKPMESNNEVEESEMTWDDIDLEEEVSEDEEIKEEEDVDWYLEEDLTDEEVKEKVEELEEAKEKVESSEVDWKKVSKELGMKTNSRQEFIDAVNQIIINNTPKVEPKSDSIKMINDLMKLSDRELLSEELKADGMDEYDIDETLDKMEDSGTLKREAVRIKRQLKNALKQEKKRITSSVENEELERAKALEKNKKDLQKHLKGVDTYFGGKVSQKDKKDLYKYITSGKFNDDIYDSHENVSEIAWMWKNKEKIKKILFSEGFEKGKAHIFNKITSPSTNRSSRPTTRIKSGTFDPSEFMKE